MEIYLGLFLIVFLLNNQIIKISRKIKFTITSFILFLLVGLRNFKIGTDTQNYVNIFNNYNENPFEVFLSHFPSINIFLSDIGFGMYMYCLKRLGIEAREFIIITAGISIFLIMQFYYKYSKDDLITFFTFISIGVYIFLFSGIRQGLAIGIVAFAYTYLIKKKVVKYCFIILIATLIHATAIIMFPVYFIVQKKFKLSLKMLTFLVIIFSFILKEMIYRIIFLSDFNLRIKFYSLSKVTKGSFLIVIMYIFIIIFYLYINSSQIRKNRIIFDKFYYLLLLGLGIYIVSLEHTMLSRFGMYLYGLVLPVANSYYIVNIKDVKIRFLCKYCCIFLEMIFFYYVISTDTVFKVYNYIFF